MKHHALRDRVVFDAPVSEPDGYGGVVQTWTTPPESHECRAEIIYMRGGEAVEASRLRGRSVYKVRIRQSSAARAITQEWRCRDAQGATYNVREIDSVTDRTWIWIVIEGGVAV